MTRQRRRSPAVEEESCGRAAVPWPSCQQGWVGRWFHVRYRKLFRHAGLCSWSLVAGHAVPPSIQVRSMGAPAGVAAHILPKGLHARGMSGMSAAHRVPPACPTFSCQLDPQSLIWTSDRQLSPHIPHVYIANEAMEYHIPTVPKKSPWQRRCSRGSRCQRPVSSRPQRSQRTIGPGPAAGCAPARMTDRPRVG